MSLTSFFIDEFQEYLDNHFAECDKVSPLDEYGTKREEVMFTDVEICNDWDSKEFYEESYNPDLIEQ